MARKTIKRKARSGSQKKSTRAASPRRKSAAPKRKAAVVKAPMPEPIHEPAPPAASQPKDSCLARIMSVMALAAAGAFLLLQL